MSTDSPLKKKTLLFAIRVVNLFKYLTTEKKEYILSKQLLRSGTNPGAMVREAFNAESGKDFIHKLKIGQKEIGETLYWLELLHETKYITHFQYVSINQDAIQVMKLIKSSIQTRRKNLKIKE